MRKILIVDDEYLVRVGIRSIVDWERYGYCFVGEAADGEEALRKIEQLHPDIVLTDLKMEGMDGFELIAACKKQYPNVKFVVLSSYDDGENVKRAMKLGACDYVFKLTAKPEEIVKILDELPYEAQANEMEQVVRKNLSAIKTRLITIAAQKKHPDRERLQEEFRQLGLTTDFARPYCVIMVSYDHSSEEPAAESDPLLIKFAIENMMQEVLSQHFPSETFRYAERFVLSVIQMEDRKNEAVEEKAAQAFCTLYEYAQRYLALHLSGALSTQCMGIDQLSKAVSDCRKRLANGISGSPGELITYRADMRSEIQIVQRYVSKHLTEELTVKEAAKLCSMSESYFSHMFKKEMGLSFVDYVNRQRVRKAERLLTNTNLRISEISAAVGVDNANYFSVLFRKINGLSPQEYRLRKRP